MRPRCRSVKTGTTRKSLLNTIVARAARRVSQAGAGFTLVLREHASDDVR